MLRKIVILFMSLSLFWTTASCSSALASIFNNNASATSILIDDGNYPIQQATYDDSNGEYSLMLLNTPPGNSPVLKTAQLQMARISEDESAQGQKTYLQVNESQPVMYLTEDFKIEYVHNVTETQNDPQTGQSQTIVVRRESNFWTPFAGAIAGQAIGNMLFAPRYYVPPLYSPGGSLVGYGGYGRSYSQAVNRYQDRYDAPPAAVKNRSKLRTTGSIRNTASKKARKSIRNSSRATGSGFGLNTLRSSGQAKQKQSKRRSSFGSSSGMRRPSRSFGGGRRRR